MLLFLPKNLAPLASVCPAGATRHALGGVRVLDRGDRYRAEATDGKRLAIVCGPSAEPRELPAALADAPDGAEAAIVPTADWKTAFRSAGKDAVGLASGTREIVLAAGSASTRCQPVEGRFPDVDGVLPKRGPLVRFVVDPDLLAGLLQVAAALNDKGSRRVEILYYGKGRSVGLMARNDSGQTVDCLIMPLD